MRALPLILALALVAGCKTSSGGGGWSWASITEPTVRVETGSVVVPLAVDAEGEPVVAELGSDLYLPPTGRRWPGIVLVPGGGNVSRKGTRTGDGTRDYEAPVDVTAAWGMAAAEAGWLTLAYDKRTCGPKDDPGCAKQPQPDLDAAGPVALAKDLDAACDLLSGRPDFNGDLVLFAHGQGAQIALASGCAAQAKAIVLSGPIPREVDAVIVDALRYREGLLLKQAKRAKKPKRDELEKQANQLKNRAGTLEATFRSIKGDKFSPDARVQGATIAFWKGWMSLTADTPKLAERAGGPILVVLGEWDLQYSPEDKERIRALSEGGALLELEKSDHHLLRRDALTPEVTTAVLDKLRALVEPPPAS
jgi:dienelactone hydrolase